eukprot:scaffold36274_cov125-Isochrysis_galbana.AAC.10
MSCTPVDSSTAKHAAIIDAPTTTGARRRCSIVQYGFSLSPTKMGGSLYFDPRRAQQSLINFSRLERTPCLAWGGNRTGSLSSRRALANRAGTWPKHDKERSKRT